MPRERTQTHLLSNWVLYHPSKPVYCKFCGSTHFAKTEQDHYGCLCCRDKYTEVDVTHEDILEAEKK